VHGERGDVMGRFQVLKVWKLAKDLAVYVYGVTRGRNFAAD